jgi:hypothetical protein
MSRRNDLFSWFAGGGCGNKVCFDLDVWVVGLGITDLDNNRVVTCKVRT